MNRLLQYLKDRWPFITKKTSCRLTVIATDAWLYALRDMKEIHGRELAKLHGQMHSERDLFQREINAAKGRADFIIQKFAGIDFHRHHGPTEGCFVVSVSFDPDAMSRISRFREDMQFLAERIGWMVQRDIASMNFVHRANANESRLLKQATMLCPPSDALNPSDWS
jgi:hypothetical protein